MRNRQASKCKFVLLLFSILFAAHAAGAAEFFIAPGGSDAAPGTRDKPLATLSAARDAVRAARARAGADQGTVTVWLRGGDYALAQSFTLESKDSGTAGAPVVYSAWTGDTPRLLGGAAVGPDWFSAVTAQSPAWARLDESARGHVLQVDLKAHGITDFGSLGPRDGSRRPSRTTSNGSLRGAGAGRLELFFGGEPMTLARWPNEGFETVLAAPTGQNGLDFTYAGDRPARWAAAADPWVFGYFTHLWSDARCPIAKIDPQAKTIRLGRPPSYGIKPKGRWYAFNILEELDWPGEWYLDRAAGVLYFWPPAPLNSKPLLVSMLADTMIQASGASYVILRGLTLDATRGDAIALRDGRGVRVERCTIRNTGERAVSIEGGTDCGVDRCEIVNTGAGGVSLRGGDRLSLTPCGHFVTNCHIRRFSRWRRTYVPAISLGGVGCRAAHNELHDAPHFALSYGGNEHLIEYNDIYDVCQVTDDAGTIYTGRDWAVRGNMLRYNFIHDVGTVFEGGSNGVHGIYLDDCASGNTIFGNIFYRISTYGVMIGGGHDNIVENNVFVECGKAAYHIDDRGQRITQKPGDGWNLREKIEKLNYTRPPWSMKYPRLAAILTDGYDEAKHPNGNRLAANIGYHNKTWIHETPRGVVQRLEQANNLSDRDPLFVDAAKLNMKLRPDSPALALPGFQDIPFEKIGRTPLPTARTMGR